MMSRADPNHTALQEEHGANPQPQTDRSKGWPSWLPSSSSWKSLKSGHARESKAPITPPPLRRSLSRTEIVPLTSSRVSPAASISNGDLNDMAASTRTGVSANGNAPGFGAGAEQATPASQSRRSRSRGNPSGKNSDARPQPARAPEWNLESIAVRLSELGQDIKDDHAELVAYTIESTMAIERRIHHGIDLFSAMKSAPIVEDKESAMRVKFKQHMKNKRDQREEHHSVVGIKTNKDRVPSYRFHHVDIKKNVLTPNTMLTFVPHLRDLESNEETEYNRWLKELEDIDLKSGFKPLNRDEKYIHSIQAERAATVSMYLDTWLEDFAIPNCNKSTLIRYMASQEPDDAITPQQKTEILNPHRQKGGLEAAKKFTDAFRHTFKDNEYVEKKEFELRNVLLLDESVDVIMESKPTAKEETSSQSDDEDEVVEQTIGSYCILGCLICYSHSCDHGEYDAKNLKRTFSLSSCSHLSDILRRRRRNAPGEDGTPPNPCRRRCYLLGPSADGDVQPRPWSKDERNLLRCIYATADHSKVKRDPMCLAADFLNRDCSDVYVEFKSLGISIPEPEPPEPARNKSLSWYDRHKKILIGDWQDHTVTHEHQRREIIEPCFHDGPCAPRVCSCVDAGILCEKYCGCTAKSCAYKFTGCACHSQGKTCQSKHKDKTCICVQLNRECDPQLCGSCGVLERADPLNAEDVKLHSTGCQNCDLQRGASKALLLGQSQLEGVGYGLFTAEDIAQDEFVIEYVGELISHDEGVRREARRGDVFDEQSNVSYVFTLLENEGIWVDAAIYGNLSRYINHASESDKRGCNITPRILYVNGEFRIKFTAMRDIRAGEELFFNYGENFPNLTKKLLDHKTGEESSPANDKGHRSRRGGTTSQVARKAPKADSKAPGRGGVTRGQRTIALSQEWQAKFDDTRKGRSRKRKRGMSEDVSDEEEYRPGEANAPGSSDERDEPPPRSSARSRKRARATSNSEPPDTPSKHKDKPKTRGKRGGARPGSGRPRKHPLPVPKPPADSGTAEPRTLGAAQASVAAARTPDPAPRPAETPTPAPVEVPARALASAEASGTKQAPSLSRNTPTTPIIRRGGRRTRATEVIEIQDSDDAAEPEEKNNNEDGADGGDEDADEDEDEDEEEDQEEDQQEDQEEDQDVVVRKRMDRVTRNRRPPAKFREEEV